MWDSRRIHRIFAKEEAPNMILTSVRAAGNREETPNSGRIGCLLPSAPATGDMISPIAKARGLDAATRCCPESQTRVPERLYRHPARASHRDGGQDKGQRVRL